MDWADPWPQNGSRSPFRPGTTCGRTAPGHGSGIRGTRVNDNKFVVVDELKFEEIKTKNFKNVMNNLNVSKALVVLAENDQNVVLSARNIPEVRTSLVNTLSVYDILKYNTVVATKAAVASIEEVYA